MKKVVILSDINLDIVSFVDKFPRGEESIHPKKIIIRPGGSGLNTAMALATSSVKVVLIGAIGKDIFGDFIVKKIEPFTDTSFIQRVNIHTGIVNVLVKDDKKTMIGFKGANEGLKFDKRWVNLIRESEIIHISPYVLSTSSGFKIFEKINNFIKNKIVTLSLSKTLIKDRGNLLDLLKYISFVFMNKDEAEEVTKQKDLKRSRVELLKYAKRAVITMGKDGAVYLDEEKLIEVEGKSGQIFNPTGAGDFFAGGFIYGILNCYSIEEALRIGIETSYRIISNPNPYFW